MTNALLSLAAAALALAAPAAAGDAIGGTRVSAKIRYADLDLSGAFGRATLERRVAVAAGSLCGAANPIDPAGHARRRACLAEVRAAARPQMVEAIRSRTLARAEATGLH